MVPVDISQLAHLSVEVLRSHWEVAAAPFADAMLWETGKSLYTLLRRHFAGSPAGPVLETAAEDPKNQAKVYGLEQQIKTAMESDGNLVVAINDLLKLLPPQSLMKVTQSGNKNVSVQTAGESNKISIRIS